jgi:KDO2-lipid IV(A) lauroyltransferase
MDLLLYVPARLVIGLAQLLPLNLVARLGRAIGAIVYFVDGRHRTVALRNLTEAFGEEKSEREIRALAKENFRRIGENFASSIKTMTMSQAKIEKVLTASHVERAIPPDEPKPHKSRVFAVGHFGNFETYARLGSFVLGSRCATTYRGLRQPGLNRLLQDMRNRSGTLFFDRRTGAAKLKQAMQEGSIMLGLLADQHAGNRALRLPFFGRECSVSTAPAVFALRYKCPLHMAICFRTQLARWQVEFSATIPTNEDGKARSVEDITRDVNRHFEEAIRRDPANWFWVHNRWKPAKKRSRKPKQEEGDSAPEVAAAAAADSP